MPFKEPVYIVCLLFLAIGLAPLATRFLRIPSLVALIVLGTIVGTNGIGWLDRNDALILLEKFGLLYIMLLAGLQIDLSNFKQMGKRSLLFGLFTFGFPFLVGTISGKLLSLSWLAALMLGILYSPHTLVSYPIILRLGLAQNPAIGVAVGGTIVTSVLTLTGLSIQQAIVGGRLGWLLWVKLLVLFPAVTFCYVAIVRWLAKQLLPDAQDSSSDASPVSQSSRFVFVLICLFSSASMTLILGLDAIVGAFIAGLTLNQFIPHRSALMQNIEFVGNSIFIPIFLISVGVLCNPRIVLTHPENLSLALRIAMGAIGGKFLAAGLAGFVFKYSWTEVMAMFGITMSRAALVLVIALFGKQSEVLDDRLFNATILYIVVTCFISPLITEFFGQKLALSPAANS
jgi:Kef-type K+ transport system membrane component KefB